MRWIRGGRRMDIRKNGGMNRAANQDVPAVRAMARQLVKTELEKLGLEKELRAAVREVLQLAVRDAVRAVLDEMAGNEAIFALPEQQGGAAAALSQVSSGERTRRIRLTGGTRNCAGVSRARATEAAV